MKLNADTTPEDLKVFLQEADELLQLLDEDFVRLEREQTNPDLLQEIFRAAHTLKGSSGMLGHQSMASVAHAMEGILDKLRKGVVAVTPQVVDALLQGLDTLKLLRDQLVSPDESDVDITGKLAELEAVGKAQDAAPPQSEANSAGPMTLTGAATEKLKASLEAGQSAYRVKVVLSKTTQWASVRCFQVLGGVSELAEVVSSIPSREDIEKEKAGLDLELIIVTRQEAERLKQAISNVEDVTSVDVSRFSLPSTAGDNKKPAAVNARPRKPGQQPQTVRIDVERLDDVVNAVGELVIDRTRITQICRGLEARYKEDELVLALRKTSAHIMKVVDGLQESTMKLRMLPIEIVFNGFPRMVRDLAQKANKKLDFIVQGQDTEIDRTVIERIRDPLVHLLRNAVDHGLESPEQRKSAGKPETGVIRLSAFHEQGHMVITVEDDGHGIDPRAVADSAVKKGLIPAEIASRLSDMEAINLIFMPGVSTAKQATEVSGRGVGMDIVSTNVAAINGFVAVDTKPGQGTKFTLKLPLTLSTVLALLVSSNKTVYAIPLVHVLETVRLRPSDIQTVGGSAAMRLRGLVLPLIPLGMALGENSGSVGCSDNTYAIIVRYGERLVGLVVDSLMETQDIVVKSLGGYIGDARGVAGASILGDGQVVLILDVPTLIKTMLRRPVQSPVAVS